jgi:ubiquinone/menaquinone biosynthesis C-methylase UbiE
MAAARLLEIGCGAGRMTRALATRFAQVDGIDISSTMIDLAREHNGGIPNARLHVGSGTDLKPFANAQFDFVLSYIVFQHIPTAAAIHGYIDEALRVLKPGGEFFFQARNDAPDGHGDTYNGASITIDQVQSIATRHGRTASIRDGAGQHYCYFTIK